MSVSILGINMSISKQHIGSSLDDLLEKTNDLAQVGAIVDERVSAFEKLNDLEDIELARLIKEREDQNEVKVDLEKL